jgi:hypothetical protein
MVYEIVKEYLIHQYTTVLSGADPGNLQGVAPGGGAVWNIPRKARGSRGLLPEFLKK